MRKLLFLISMGGACWACGGNDAGKGSDQALDVAPVFKHTDSIELVYYPNPDNQKDYQFRRSSDSTLIILLMRDLEGDSIATSVCLHYKKLYLFSDGDVYKTVYVSDSCNYLAFAVNSKQQFRKLSADTREKLADVYSEVVKKKH